MPRDAVGRVGSPGFADFQGGMQQSDLLSDLPCGVVVFDDDGRVLAVNGALERLLGFAPGEIEGRHVESLLTVGGRIFYQTHFFPLLRLHGSAQEVFLPLRCRDGGEVGVLANAVRAERDGRMVSQCVLLEVRERRRYEDELLRARRAAESVSAALVVRTREVEAANERLERQALELAQQQRRLEEQAAELEAQRAALESANAVLRAHAEELERARAAAEEASRAKSHFLATVSHELRTPLNAIGGYAQLLELGIHGPVTPAQQEALQRIVRSHGHLLHLVNEVLNLVRVESGRVDYQLEDVPVAALVAQVTPMIEPQMATARLALSVAVDDGLVARADREKVLQILLNLLGNAVKFTPAGGRVAVETSGDGSAGGVLIRVADTGIGIPPSKLERIFEPFVQVEVAHSRRTDGIGLGLAISRDLARGMGGDLTVESREGVGSVFTLALPPASDAGRQIASSSAA